MHVELENRHPAIDREAHHLKPPCRCGGREFVEPKMKITNCLPEHCRDWEDDNCCCCCCDRNCEPYTRYYVN